MCQCLDRGSERTAGVSLKGRTRRGAKMLRQSRIPESDTSDTGRCKKNMDEIIGEMLEDGMKVIAVAKKR